MSAGTNMTVQGAASGTTRSDRVTSAIAQASRRTGMDFGYLLGQAKIESSLNPTAKARTSSATGLYQFIDQSWLAVIDKHGDKYGLGWAADAVKRSASGRYSVSDPQLRQQILDLRKHPETASVMAAEHAADNKEFLEERLGRKAESVDLYLAHFLGAGGAAKFLRTHDAYPNASAASMFPAAASANKSIFYDKSGQPRSFAEIRQNFAAKLGRATQNAMNGGSAANIAGQDFAALALSGTDQSAEYARTETQRLQQSLTANDLVRPQPQTARLAYLMLATFGR
ncbi:MAG: lytic transglycosylase domain-containing protein [Sphingobium sp.]|nr:lytic transglycosylase domain-containing protein [Sphingobium sp.]